MMTPDTAKAIAEATSDGRRLAVLLRHAERPPLEKGDMTFGKNLQLTENGMRSAEEWGRLLASISGTRGIALFYGESRRCCMTARQIAKSFDPTQTTLAERSFLGGNSPYLADVTMRMALAGRGDYLAALNEYFAKGEQQGFNPLMPATAEFERLLFAQGGTTLSVFVTHDLNLACYMAGRGIVAQFTARTWPGFLASVHVLL